MQYFVYILYSEKLNRFYTGTTDDTQRRLEEHNTNFYEDSFTYRGIPWRLYLAIPCVDSKTAYSLEKFIKKMKSSAFIKKLASDENMLNDILKRIESGRD